MKFCHFQKKVRTTKATPSRLILQLYLPPLIQSFRTFSKSQLKSSYAIQRYASDIWVCIFVVIDWLFSPKYALFIYKLENPHYYCKKIKNKKNDSNTVEPPCATTSRVNDSLPSVTAYPKHQSFPVKALQLDPLINDHLQWATATTLWACKLNDFLLFLTSCKRPFDVFSDLYLFCVHCATLNIQKTLVTTWNYIRRNLEIACNKLSSIK